MSDLTWSWFRLDDDTLVAVDAIVGVRYESGFDGNRLSVHTTGGHEFSCSGDAADAWFRLCARFGVDPEVPAPVPPGEDT